MTAEVAVARRSFRQVRTAAIVWALVFGGTVASSALAYAAAYPTVAERHQAAVATSRDPGLAVLLGPVSEIETVGGYTVYKSFVFLTCIGAIWGLLAATRLLRGEEDAGRWGLVLAGPTRAAGATLATLAALGAAVAVVFVGTTTITALAGRDPDLAFPLAHTLLYGGSLAAAPALFVAVGAVTSQLARSRRVATGLGMAVFAVAMVVRMVADSGPSTRWLLWLSPFGWIERMRPYTEADWRPLALAAVTTVGLAALAVWLAGRRDVGSGVVADDDESDARPFGLGSAGGLVLRREAGVLAAWVLGTAAGAFAFGMVGKVAEDALPDSSLDVLKHFGVSGAVTAQYFGVTFLFVATLVALLPAGQVGAAADDEAGGRLALMLALPVRRAGVFGARLAITAAAIVLAAALAGLGAWAGAASQGVDAGLATMVGAGLNTVPTALVVLGIGALYLGVAPRSAAPAVYAVVIASLVIHLLASLVDSTRWMQRLSLFHYMALAPAATVHASSVLALLGIALVLCGAATALFARRDVARV